MSKTDKVSDILLAFVRPGESGQCGKECGSGNCGFNVVKKGCPGIIEEVPSRGNIMLRIHCDSWQVTDREEARSRLTSFVRCSSKRSSEAA